MLIKDYYSGNCFNAYEYFGAHKANVKNQSGYKFRVFAPNAVSVNVTGEFNNWQETAMQKNSDGIYEVFIPNVPDGQMYQYLIGNRDGTCVRKTDPYGFQMEKRPGISSKTCNLEFKFTDEKWIKNRDLNYTRPLNIYEMHFGSWKQKSAEGDEKFFSYKEMSALIIPYLKENNFTHLELLPINEHALDMSWGYQVSGFFSVTSRYGTPEDFACFINDCHNNNIGVILDFVPTHFIIDDFGLQKFDGTAIYEYNNNSIAYSEWGTCNFDYYKNEVRSFLMSAANFWLTEYHIDGLRMDAISNAIYWGGDSKRGVNNGAIKFLQDMNNGLRKLHPSIMLIAEDSSSYPKVTARSEYGGLGFDYKWDLGFMNDTLEFFKLPPNQRPDNYYKLVFSMMYFFNELYILPFSHDEVVHGKATIIQKMWGDYENKFPQVKALYLYIFSHPGKKLNFMGNELGHFREWDEKTQLDWNLLEYPKHDSFFHFFRKLSEFYHNMPELYSTDFDNRSFKWLEVNAPKECVYAFIREFNNHSGIVTVLNLSDKNHKNFRIGCENSLILTQIINTDNYKWGGNTPDSDGTEIHTENIPHRDNSHSFNIDIPAFSGILFKVEF